MHGRWTDLNLVVRGKRAVIKCTHVGNVFVVLYADPISDLADVGSYTVQFGEVGRGSEVYTIPHHRYQCPHEVYDKLVAGMQLGQRPDANRVPQPQDQTTTPGTELPNP